MISRVFILIIAMWLTLPAWSQSPLDGMSESDLAEGQKLFRVHCARCHGIAGEGGEGSNLAKPRLKYAPDDEALLAVLENGIPGTGMPSIWTLNSEQAPKVAAYVKSLGEIDAEEMPGDPEKGAGVYADAACSTCHIIAGQGVGIGPELTEVGDRRGLAYLRQSLSDPAVAQSQTAGFQDYLTVRATTGNGQLEGVRISEDAFSIQVRDVSGTVHSFRKDDLRDLQKVFAHSLMPEYGAVLSQDDTDDLISYLMSLRSEQ